jgi:hypothetical protein
MNRVLATIASTFAVISALSFIATVQAPTASAFRSCAEARAAGAAPLYAGQPGYSKKLDRDGDGVACEGPGGARAAPATATAGPVCSDSSSSKVAIIGCNCDSGVSNASTADGSAAYCRAVQSTSTYLWSLRPDAIPNPSGSTGVQTGVCMAQTGRSAADCATYLSQPNFRGAQS